MDKILLLLLTFLGWGMVQECDAQITINTSTFPSVGDVVIQYAASQANIDVKPEATGYTTWDFKNLAVSSQTTITYERPTEKPYSDFFTGADMYVQSGGIGFYYDKQSDKVVEMGLAGMDPILNLIETYNLYEGHRYSHRSGITYGSTYRNEFSMKFSESKENLPDTFQGYLNTFGIDSIRFVSNVEEEDEIDAYGELQIGDKTYDVLRAKRVTIIDSEIYAYQGLFGWVPVDPELLPIEGISNFVGRDTVESYVFLANDVKAPVAQITMDRTTNTPTRATFLDRTASSTTPSSNKAKEITAYPNPTYGEITFTVKNHSSNRYRLEVYNIIGVKLLSKEFSYGSDTLKTNLQNLSKGTYLYSIFDNEGNKLTTKRLVIVTP